MVPKKPQPPSLMIYDDIYGQKFFFFAPRQQKRIDRKKIYIDNQWIYLCVGP